MQHIVEWLETLGMSEYAGRFAENRIDFSVLPDLTDQHLKDLGLPLGDRLKMLRAIRELAVVSLVSSEASSAEQRGQGITARRDAAPVQAGAPAAEVSGERRYLTVMFCDLVGSTSTPSWQELSSRTQAWVGAAMCSACRCGSHDRWP